MGSHGNRSLQQLITLCTVKKHASHMEFLGLYQVSGAEPGHGVDQALEVTFLHVLQLEQVKLRWSCSSGIHQSWWALVM